MVDGTSRTLLHVIQAEETILTFTDVETFVLRTTGIWSAL